MLTEEQIKEAQQEARLWGFICKNCHSENAMNTGCCSAEYDMGDIKWAPQLVVLGQESQWSLEELNQFLEADRWDDGDSEFVRNQLFPHEAS